MEARIILKGSVTKDGIGTQEARIENEDTKKEEANSSYVSSQLPKSQTVGEQSQLCNDCH